jgi:6-phosphogluconolactonase (cycloisomerase 2 family)
MILIRKMSLVLIALGLATLVGCGSSATHTAYVALAFSNTVAAYRINNHSGSFTNIVGSPFPAGNSPSSVLVHPASKFVYVANQSENTISLFYIDSAIGSLSEVLPRTATGLTPVSMVMDKGGTFLFAVNQLSSSISAYSITPGTGVLKPVAGSPFFTFPNPVAAATSPSGKFLYVVNPNLSSVIAFSVTSGVLSAVGGPVLVDAGPHAVAVDPAEKFVYVANSAANTVSVLTINPTTGALTPVQSFATGTQPFSLAVLGQFLYVGNLGSSSISAFSVNASTGVLTQITNSPFSGGGAALFMVIDPNENFLYVGSQSAKSISVLSIAPSTGVLTQTSQSAATGVAPTSMSVSK